MAFVSWIEESHGKPRSEYRMLQLRFELSLPKQKLGMVPLTNMHGHFFKHLQYKYAYGFYRLKFNTLFLTWRQLDALFRINVYNVLKFCSFLLETVGLRMPTWNLTDFAFSNVGSKHPNVPSDKCASAANNTCEATGVFREKLFVLWFVKLITLIIRIKMVLFWFIIIIIKIFYSL